MRLHGGCATLGTKLAKNQNANPALPLNAAQVDQAAAQLATANSRYQEALVQLHSERSQTAHIEVRTCGPA